MEILVSPLSSFLCSMNFSNSFFFIRPFSTDLALTFSLHSEAISWIRASVCSTLSRDARMVAPLGRPPFLQLSLLSFCPVLFIPILDGGGRLEGLSMGGGSDESSSTIY